jgi:hypothetical protein
MTGIKGDVPFTCLGEDQEVELAWNVAFGENVPMDTPLLPRNDGESVPPMVVGSG